MTHARFAPLRSLLTVFVMLFSSLASAEWKETVLHDFQGGSDGFSPFSIGVVFDKAGNLYGATSWGGAENCTPMAYCGTVYQVKPPAKNGGSWTETVLYVFKGKAVNDGDVPNGGLIIDGAGNLYGTTSQGGTGTCSFFGGNGGCGTVFELSPPTRRGGSWKETILYSFENDNYGNIPIGNLISDTAGNLYGATMFGGGKGTNCDTYYGGNCGTVFEVSPPKQKGGRWTEKVLYSFTGGPDGAQPNGNLALSSNGTVYGTTYYGGDQSGRCAGTNGEVGGCGTVFAVKPPITKGGKWKEEVLHRFNIEQAFPAAGVILGLDGELYGTTTWSPNGYGLVFELEKPISGSHEWTEKVLHEFHFYDGWGPVANLTLDIHGDLYGTTESGTSSGGGTVFKLARRGSGHWNLTTLYAFNTLSDGAGPQASVILDRLGNLYGTTEGGGTGNKGQCSYQTCGVVFEVHPAGRFR